MTQSQRVHFMPNKLLVIEHFYFQVMALAVCAMTMRVQAFLCISNEIGLNLFHNNACIIVILVGFLWFLSDLISSKVSLSSYHLTCRQRLDDKWEHDLYEDNGPCVSSMDGV